MVADAHSPSSPSQTLSDFHLSLDGDSPRIVNGFKPAVNDVHHAGSEDALDPLSRLQQELERTREERDEFATQYRNLLGKLQTMRNTLGNKLKQDTPTAQNEDLLSTLEVLQGEVLALNVEAERAARELDGIDRSESRLLREAHAELERTRTARDGWEAEAMAQRVRAEEVRITLDATYRELTGGKEACERDAAARDADAKRANNLQAVLEDFQSFTWNVPPMSWARADPFTQQPKLEENSTNNARTQALEQEVKERTLLIGKLRHEGECLLSFLDLFRLRRGSANANVDWRLVTNILLTFLNTPREDSKRLETLGLLASNLSWSDEERVRTANSPIQPRLLELEKIHETEVHHTKSSLGMS
ncbi:hypothetical protein BC826DRAFT_1098877 [Russula brevipes]|nr:hypothetical protein BC826DRAFT_1098877 [Russula brevipes]